MESLKAAHDEHRCVLRSCCALMWVELCLRDGLEGEINDIRDSLQLEREERGREVQEVTEKLSFSRKQNKTLVNRLAKVGGARSAPVRKAFEHNRLSVFCAAQRSGSRLARSPDAR